MCFNIILTFVDFDIGKNVGFLTVRTDAERDKSGKLRRNIIVTAQLAHYFKEKLSPGYRVRKLIYNLFPN